MQLRASPHALALGVAGLGILGMGIALAAPPLVVWGGCICLGVGFARALTELRIQQLRGTGFEMAWSEKERRLRAARGQKLTVKAEIRNRSKLAVRCSDLRALADSNLSVVVTPSSAEIPPLSALQVDIAVEAHRVGRHCIHGLSLQADSGPTLFAAPLAFTSPLGLETLPHVYQHRSRSAIGGRSRRESPHGHPRRRRGESGEFSEVRDHQVGDPFKRIAWRASARRGKLLVRDYELQEHEVVWLVLDASVELWSGPVGWAPLDLAIDEVARLADQHLAAGDSVGLVVVGARVMAKVAPDSGPAALGKILETLAFETHTQDGDRSGLDEQEAAAWVLEHLCSLDPRANRSAARIDRVAQLASEQLPRAPFPAPNLHASSGRDSLLRQYLAAMGISSPARLQQDRPRTDRAMVEVLQEISRSRPHPTRLYLCSPPPDDGSLDTLKRAIARLPRHHLQLCWVPIPHEPSLLALRETTPLQVSSPQALHAVSDALELRMRVLQRQGERSLHQLGVRMQHWKPLPPADVNRNE